MTNYQHIAEQMYAAYCQQAGGLTFDGKPLPSFQELGLERQTCWKAAAEAAHKQYAQPQADALDTERLDWLIEQGCSNGVVYEFDKSFWMVWLDGHDAHKDEHQIGRYHTAREAIDAAIAKATGVESSVALPVQAVEKSATHGMNLHQRILHVGGRENAQTYIEFGSVAAVRALVDQVLRDLPDSAHGFVMPAPQPQADAMDAERWRFIKRKLCLTGNGDGTCAMQALNLPARILGWPDVGELAIAQFLDGAIDAAIAEKENK